MKSKNTTFVVYATVDGTTRIEYKGHIIQIYGYDDGTPDLNIMHFIIDPEGHDLCEQPCLLEAITFIDKRVQL